MNQVLQFRNPPDAAAFCETPTAGAILDICRIAQNRGWMGAIVGAPGIGKSQALAHYAAATPDVAMATMTATTASLTGSLARVFEAIEGDGPVRHSRPATLFDAIVAAIRTKPGGRYLLIVDEAQELSPAALNELRFIHDETGCGIVVAGNPDVIGQFREGHGRRGRGRVRPAFLQVDRRIAIRRDFRRPMPEDVPALARHLGVTDTGAIEALTQLGRYGHGLALPANAIALARDFAGGQPVDRAAVETAVDLMGVRDV